MSTDERKQAARRALDEAVFGTGHRSAASKPAPASASRLQSGAGEGDVRTPKQRAVDALRDLGLA